MLRVITAALVLSSPAFAEDFTCETELDAVSHEIEGHIGAESSLFWPRDVTCEDTLRDAVVEWERVHEQPWFDEEIAEAGLCLERCSCGFCLQWNTDGGDHVGSYDFSVEIEG